ncbi:MAG TPA: hypothetical protein VMF67_13420 [Rhizomicrobium sp.]|nr:hypothetical protein [Rhizomicrobium sp.]
MSSTATLAIAAHALFAAKIATFGCSSLDEVARLQHLRPDQRAFQTELMQQMFYGQCVAIEPGKLVIADSQASDPQVLLIDRAIEPPGYLAPAIDFERHQDRDKP